MSTKAYERLTNLLLFCMGMRLLLNSFFRCLISFRCKTVSFFLGLDERCIEPPRSQRRNLSIIILHPSFGHVMHKHSPRLTISFPYRCATSSNVTKPCLVVPPWSSAQILTTLLGACAWARTKMYREIREIFTDTSWHFHQRHPNCFYTSLCGCLSHCFNVSTSAPR